jgi:DNA-binding transcriptional ArsR family regulator
MTVYKKHMAAAVQVIQNPETAATLFSPSRMRILERLAEPNTAAGIARDMELPRQQVGYHLRELELAGLVEFVEERRKGNCVERVVRAAARSFVISPEALGKLGATPEQRRDRFSAGYLIALAARAIRDLAASCSRAEKAGKRISTLAFEVDIRFATADSRSQFADELAQEVARLAAKYHDEKSAGGRKFRFFGGVYPAITREEPAETNSVRIQ